MNLATFRKHLIWAEGWRERPYTDTTGHLSIGVGRNLERGLSADEINYLLDNDIRDTINKASTLEYWSQLDSVRQMVVADCVFNLGLEGWLKFTKANEALIDHNYREAAIEMADSLWYRQVGRRARKLVVAMHTGEWQ